MALPTLAEQRHADIDLMYDDTLPWVKSASVNGGDPFSVRMNYDPNPAWSPVDDVFSRSEASCYVRMADLANPDRRLEITIDNVVWTVTQAAAANDYEWRLSIERNVKVTF
ncbi:MAG: hypothetical protein SWH61_03315 [Thermodesulfobacteriota bacterium]|nr:hypothetical protein [Thermodesulfobacteriota bacterium]